jgi:hypothetical protein
MDATSTSLMSLVCWGTSCFEKLLRGLMLCSSGVCRCPKLCFRGAMYVVVSKFKTVHFSGMAKARLPLSTPFTTSWVDGASIREASGSS